MSPPKTEEAGGVNCKFRKPAGSYYAPQEWTECSKMNYSMCDIDAGGECRFKGEE